MSAPSAIGLLALRSSATYTNSNRRCVMAGLCPGHLAQVGTAVRRGSACARGEARV